MTSVIYVFNYENNFFDKAKKRLEYSMDSLINQDVYFYILNNSQKELSLSKKYPCIIEHIPLNYYNKPQSLNYLVKKFIKADFYISSDIDIVYPEDYINNMIAVYNKNKPCRIIPFIYRTENEIYSIDTDELYKNSYTNIKNLQNLGAGIGLVTVESFFKINGYDEVFGGFSNEDHDFNLRIAKVCSIVNNYSTITYHLWHEQLRMENIKVNLQYFNKKLLNFDNYVVANENKQWGIY